MGKLREGLQAVCLAIQGKAVNQVEVSLLAFLKLVVDEVEGPATLPSVELPPMTPPPSATPNNSDVTLAILRMQMNVEDIQCCPDCRRLGTKMAVEDLEKLAELLGVELAPWKSRDLWGHNAKG